MCEIDKVIVNTKPSQIPLAIMRGVCEGVQPIVTEEYVRKIFFTNDHETENERKDHE